MRRSAFPLVFLLAALFGCAHPIVITPDIMRLEQGEVQPIACNVGYVISDANRALEVTSPGGGGDKIRYFPYKELEPAMFKVLSNQFQRAYPMKAADEAATIKAKGITLVFVPEVRTDSSSSSILTWPPTRFQVDLHCKALDPAGALVWEKRLSGSGEAEFSEFRSDFPLAAKRAALKAFQELQKELNSAPELRAPRPAPVTEN